MDPASERHLSVAAGFINSRAPSFHPAFAATSSLDKDTMTYGPEIPEQVEDLRETLECHQAVARKYVDFAPNVLGCTWDDVHRELQKAKAAEEESKRRGGNLARKVWRSMGTTGSILAPGLSAIPDDLCVLHGGLAVIFSLARHSSMNRIKILTAFERVPNIIEEAQNKAKSFPVNHENPRTVKLHSEIHVLRDTLVRVLPVLINILIPNTFKNIWKSPFRGWKIDELLDQVSGAAESLRFTAEGLIDDIIVNNHAISKTIHSQLVEVLRHQKVLQMSIESAHSKTRLLHFIMEQLTLNGLPGASASGNGAGEDAMTERGTALPGLTPTDLLAAVNVHHLRVSADAQKVIRANPTLPQADVERCAMVIMAPQIKQLLSPGRGGSGTIVVDGRFDRAQMGKVSPLSYVCAMVAQALRSQAQPQSPPTSPLSEKPPTRNGCIVLEFYCALHASTLEESDDDLSGPQGLLRALIMQMVLGLVATEVIINADEPVRLPYLRDGEEKLLAQHELGALCRLFVELVRLAPEDMVVYCFVDGWSAYERDLWHTDYDALLNMFHDVTVDGGAGFRLLLTSASSCRWLGDFVLPGQRVSLVDREASGREWCGPAGGGLKGLARAATMLDGMMGLSSGY